MSPSPFPASFTKASNDNNTWTCATINDSSPVGLRVQQRSRQERGTQLLKSPEVGSNGDSEYRVPQAGR